ncbi:LysR substrate-binding domain-containing protein [Haloglycomyces albus]|uniref:LysR substrate-binding domain-containing protein n=1 Tax=Haloglycomyces albus TaxID=526067 RepID=UPI00046D5F2E|nr:LysR substrate-binding domain-containing protein [Haloglycomyces albus]
MRPQQLKTFLTVADNRHFTRAAEQLNISQPALSKQIQALEATIGASLFTRHGGQVHLTDIGHTLVPHARRIVTATDDALSDLHNHVALAKGRLRIGATPTICSWLIPPLLATYHENHPGVDISLTESGSSDLTELLKRGDVEVALTAHPLHYEASAAIDSTPLLHESLVIAQTNRQPPLAAQACIGLGQLSQQPFILPTTGFDLRTLTLEACRQAGFQPRIAIDGGNTDTIVDLVATGMGVALLPAMTATQDPRIRTTPLAPPGAVRTIAMERACDTPRTKAAAAFEKTLDEHLMRRHAWGQIPSGLHII